MTGYPYRTWREFNKYAHNAGRPSAGGFRARCSEHQLEFGNVRSARRHAVEFHRDRQDGWAVLFEIGPNKAQNRRRARKMAPAMA